MSTQVQPTSLRTILTLAWPMVISRSTQTVIGLSDAVMVTHLGASSIAATTVGAFNTFLFLILPWGVMWMVGTFASQYFGANDLRSARRYAWYGLALALLTQGLTLLSLPFLGHVLNLFDYDKEVYDLVQSYMNIRLCSIGAAAAIEAMGSYYGGIGNTRLPMLVNVFAMVLNVFGNYALINGLGPVAAMGVRGAALSNAIATTCAFLLLFIIFLRSAPPGEKPELRRDEMYKLLKYGVPSGLNWFFEFLAFSLFVNVVVSGLGKLTLAAFMAVMQINSVSFMPSFALASSGAILVGQAIGANEKQRVPKILGLTLSVALTWQTLAALTYLVVPGLLMLPFAPKDETKVAFMASAVLLLRLSAGWQIFDALATTFAEMLRAAGDTIFVLWARLAIAWAVFVPGVYYTVKVLGGRETAAVLWLILYLGLLALAVGLRYMSGAWQRMKLIEPHLV